MISPAALDVEFRLALEAVGRVLFIERWPDVPLRWNRRLRRAGRAVIDRRGSRFRAAFIEISPVYFEVYPEDLRGILVHEAVHVGLAYLGRPFGHGAEFRTTCEAAGGLLHSRWLPGRVFRYRCPVCGVVLERRRRAADSRWCADCVEAAETAGEDAYASSRAMQLVETVFQGPEAAAAASQPVCENGVDADSGPAPLRYPVAPNDESPPRAGGP
ncbi:MAG: SprT-like domain-containing protein [Planctomycetota bacterium]|nr:SprT-like domain-containing protein [Planctomycetota bacterium]